MNGFVLTVTQLNTYVKSMLDGDENLSSVFVRGEISNFTNHYRSGHYYLSLKDSGALIRAVMFRSSASRLRFLPENGMRVIVRGRVSLYERDGQYQLYIDDMQPEGAGALQLAFEQMKERLAAEGLFDDSHKKPIPAFPRRVGVITSPTGAAVRDIIQIVTRRYPLCEVVLCPVSVQGDLAPGEITAAIRKMNEEKAADVLIVGRGGGSLEELWAFNEEAVARAVFASEIPVISAVGHETDYTICDFAADLRAPTPSAAAELAVPDRLELMQSVSAKRAFLSHVTQARLNREKHRLDALLNRRCLSSPLYPVEERRMRLDDTARKLASAFDSRVLCAKERFAACAGRLDAMSPLKVLSRGYCIASADGRVLSRTCDVPKKEPFSLRMSDGELLCRVAGKEQDNAEKNDL
ncbi:MAG: exodeoxyribonuclease VII large subunit [Clostridiales bacterium]|nr:exodeoxyribonuclease VII large subunit [Clostridiales bacterium]